MDDLELGNGVVIPAAELSVRFTRSSGPGGQNVNKRATRAELTFDLGASDAVSPALKRRALARLGARVDARGRIRVVSGAARTQAENRARVLERLVRLLDDAMRPPPKARRPTRPSKRARERRLQQKKARAQVKARRRKPVTDNE